MRWAQSDQESAVPWMPGRGRLWSRCPSGRHRGFTLLEMLVVMSLLSLIVLGMGSALRTTAQTGGKIDLRLLHTDEVRVMSGFLRSALGRVYFQRPNQPSAVGQSPFFFEGRPDQVTWIGIMPARHGLGGRYYFRLALGQSNGETGLLLAFTPWSSDQPGPDWSREQVRLLLPGATGLALQYASSSVEPFRWMPAWQAPETMPDAAPDRISLSIASPAGPLPLLVIPMRSTPKGLRGIGGGEAVFGGSS